MSIALDFNCVNPACCSILFTILHGIPGSKTPCLVNLTFINAHNLP